MKKKVNLITHLTRFYLKYPPKQLRNHSFSLLLALICLGGTVSSPAQTYSPNPEEFVGPFTSWVNVKTKYGAKGDGTSDDTQALQRAFNEIGTTTVNNATVLYLPAGTYRITAELKMSARLNISVIGEDPSTTKIKWSGPAGGIMFYLNGVSYSRFSRLTWDGAKSANTAIAHKWDGSTGYAVTHNEHSDEVFVDVGHGLRAGVPHKMDAETAVLRCRFIRNTIAGVSIESFNALDWYIWDSYFEDCRVGVTNNPPTGGAGNFHVLHSMFKRSTYADISVKNTNYYSVRHNYSIGSKAFFVGELMGQNGGPITIQRNIILDPLDESPIRTGNKGPMTLLDNTIRSRDGQVGPVIWTQGDIISVGNTFTINNTIQAPEKKTIIDDVVTSRASVNPSEPVLQAMPLKRTRRIFELPNTDLNTKFQKVIDSAAALTGQRPVIHVRPGNHGFNRTVIIPAGADIQFIGDGFASKLSWSGAEGVDAIRMEGGENVVMSELTLFGGNNPNWGTTLVIKQSDQAGKQVFMEGVSISGSRVAAIQMEGFKYTNAELHNINHGKAQKTGVKVIGGGSATNGRLNIFAGASSDNFTSYDLSNGGSLMAQDIWYESAYQMGFLNLTGSGNFTLNGAKMYATKYPEIPITLNNYAGKATLLGVMMNGKIEIKGDGSDTEALVMGNQFHTANAYSNTSPNAKAAMVTSRIYSGGSYPLSNIGTADANFIREMLKQVRNELPRYKTDDIGAVLHRIRIIQAHIGIRIMPGNAIVSQPLNQAPAVALTTPSNSTTIATPANIAIAANASDADGQVAKVEFYSGTTKLGEDADGSNGWNYTWSNVAAGNYSIAAKATDNTGAVATSGTVSLTVSTTAVPNQTPTVSAGSDKTITLPTSTVTLLGTASDADGEIATYAWTKQSGPTATLSGAATASLSASGLVAGTYLFRLTVTDNKGATKFDEVAVTVNAATASVQQAVTSLTLINADTDREIATLTNGYVINFATIGTKNLSIRANTNPSTVGSVIFRLNSKNIITESKAPYTIAGDASTNYYAWTPALGNHTLAVTPYTAAGGKGTAGTALTVNFSVVNSTANTRQATQSETAFSFASVYPNPASTTTTLKFTTVEGGEADVVLSNLTGLHVKRIRIVVKPGNNAVTIPVDNLQAGYYHIRVGDYHVLERILIAR